MFNERLKKMPENYGFLNEKSEAHDLPTKQNKISKEQMASLLQLRFSLNEKQKQELLQKQQRVQNALLKIGVAKNQKALENYSKYNELNDYDKYTLVADNYWRLMNGNNHKWINVPITDTHFWYYFNETCFEKRENFQKYKLVENNELVKYQREYEKAKIDFVVKDVVEPIQKIIEQEPPKVILKPEEDKLELNAEITIPEIKNEVHEVTKVIDKKPKNNKPIKNEDQASLF